MRNRITIIILAAAALFFTATCARTKENNGVVEIKERLFLAQVNDVYLNAEDYLGKTIKLEGIFAKEQYYAGEDPFCIVFRYGPGCCGNDDDVGFEVKWTGNRAKQYPKNDSWVKAEGVLKFYEEEEFSDCLYLDLSSLTVLSKRGKEQVR